MIYSHRISRRGISCLDRAATRGVIFPCVKPEDVPEKRMQNQLDVLRDISEKLEELGIPFMLPAP